MLRPLAMACPWANCLLRRFYQPVLNAENCLKKKERLGKEFSKAGFARPCRQGGMLK